jgi:bifunctional non-homologous end joining protein LigD
VGEPRVDPASGTDALDRYRRKRNFARTPEPAGTAHPARGFSFVIQRHAATRLHYDLRLELDGTFRSWAVPKGPSLDPAERRIAVQVEDHPLEYGDFEGVIPEKQYGAGTVIVWDRGTWEPLGDPRADYAAGKLKFRLHGVKLEGSWALIRMKPKPGAQTVWLFIKERDAAVRPAAQYDITEALPDSVLSGAAGREWTRSGERKARPAQRRRKADPLPLALAPQLAALVDAPPAGDWAYEFKFDGYRLLARVNGGEVRLFTRNGHDWTSKMPALAQAIGSLGVDTAWLDGEIVVVSPDGRTDFQALQNAFDRKAGTADLQYYVFDLPYCDGRDLRDVPLAERRAQLKSLLAGAKPPLHFSESFGRDGLKVLQKVAEMGGEGVVGKRQDARYESGRSNAWIKLKTAQRQEFVVVGFTAPKGSRTGLGALVLAVNDPQGRLQYAGTVGSGFSESGMPALMKRLTPLRRKDSPAASVPKSVKATWLEPRLVAEVTFTEWTRDGSIRHPVFKGLRDDKEPARIVREVPVSIAPANSAPAVAAAGIKITHADRVIDATTGLTKGHLVAYYATAAADLLAYLKGRPVALVRAPSGIGGNTFFQKAADTLKTPGIVPVPDGKDTWLAFTSEAALLYAAQLNVVEFHPWNATAKAIDRPDRIVFDLDPGEGVAFEQVREAALLVKTLLDELGLVSFLKTSGGKGLHLVVPITARLGWDEVKDFSAAVVRHLERLAPTRFASKIGAQNRIGKILIDVGRNARGATTAAAYSARARPGLGVSMPCTWEELDTLTSGSQWNIVTAGARLEQSRHAWQDFPVKQSIAQAVRRLGRG